MWAKIWFTLHSSFSFRNLLPNTVLLFYFILFFMKLLTYLFMYKFLNLFLFIIVLLLVRMRFHLNTLFDILKRIDLWRAYYDASCEIHLINGILIHESTHTQKVIKHLYVKKTHPFNTPIVVQLIDVSDHFCPQEDDKETLSFNSTKVPYFNKINGLMYLVNCTRSDITFLINFLAMYY